jgi:hypothetical protein
LPFTILPAPASQARQTLLAALDGPVQSIAFKSTATSGNVNQQLSILDIKLATALGEAPVNLTRDLRNATLEAMGPLPSEAKLHLDTAVLKGLTAARVALEDLAVFLGNPSTSSNLAYTAKSSSFATQASVADLSGRSLAELIAIGRSDRLDGQPVLAPAFSPAELAELLKRDLILKPTDIGLIDDIHTLDEAVRVLLRPVESPLEVLRNTNPLPPLPAQPPLVLAEGSLFPDATLAAFGDVDLGGPSSYLYLGGARAGRIAVDPMFASVAQACAGTALGVVLTGMGSDGAKGALQLRERGNPVLVQDEASSVVWGMPGSVMTAGAADAVIAIERMPTSILEWMEWTSRGNP